MEYYSYVLMRNSIGNEDTTKWLPLIYQLNEIPGSEGYIFQNYCLGGGNGRLYFSDENGKKIDAMRQKINQWCYEKYISEDQYYFLLASLIEAADRVANTASVYGAFLKKIKPSAAKPLILRPLPDVVSKCKNLVCCEDANKLIKIISGDILYLDPPYNARQYGANYHLLNTIAKYEELHPRGITGLPDYYKSDYCKRGLILIRLEELIAHARFKFIFLSYNNEGLASAEEIWALLSRYGKCKLIHKAHSRFRADKGEARNHIADKTIEYLFVLEKHI